MERGSEKPGTRPRVEDAGGAVDQPSTHVGDRRRRGVVLRAGEVVVVDGRDAFVLGAELVEVAGAVQAVDVDSRGDSYTPRGERSSSATFMRSRIETMPTTFPPSTTGRWRKPPWIISEAA